MSLLQQPQIKGIGPTTLGNPFSQFVAPTAPEPVVPSITPRKPPVDLTSQGAVMPSAPVIEPKLPQGIPEPQLQPTYANNPFEDNKNGVTRDQFGQTQSKPGTLGTFDPSNLISGIKNTGKNIQETTNEVGDFFQNKAPGLEKAKQENRFLTQDHLTSKITTAIQQMPDATDEEIAQAIGQLKNEGYIFEGMNDRNFDNPVTNFLGQTPLGAGSDLLGGAIKMGGNFIGGTLQGGAQMSEGVKETLEGNTNKGISNIVAGGTNYGLNILNGAFPGVSSVFNTEAVKPVIENTLQPLQEGIQENIVNKGLDLTGMDPNSEEYQNYSNALSTIGTILTTMGIAKTGQIGFEGTFGKNLNYGNTTVKDFVKNTGKTADDFGNAIKQAKPDFKGNIKDSTPISKVFTPEEYAQVRAIAENNGATGVGRREGLISDATQAKIKGKVTNGFRMAEKRAKEPTPIQDMGTDNAINSQGIRGTVPKPTVLTNIKDKVFGDSNDIDLANRAVSPRNVKGKTMADKMQGGKVALSGLQQLHDDSIAGNITADIGTLEGGIAGLEEARQYHGKIIGENADPNQKIAVTDIGQILKEDLQNPIMVISGPIKGIGDDLVQMLDHPSYQDGVNMKDVQTTLSTISNRIRNSPELRNSLRSEPAGQAVSTFIDELSARYEKAIEEGGNGITDKQARQAYAKIMKIQNDLLNSGMVNARNTRTGQSGFVGKSIATYELLTNGVSGIPVALAMKYLGETKGEYATRGGAYAKLIRNMDRKALQRTQGKYNTGDTSKYTPKPTPKTENPTPKPKPNARNTVNNNGVSPDPVDLAGTKGKPTPKSDIPGARKTKIEVPGNKKGNITSRLAGDKGVILGPQKLLGDGKIVPKQLMAPKNPKGTITPRSDVVAESMRNTNSKRPDITPNIKPLTEKKKSDMIESMETKETTSKEWKTSNTHPDNPIKYKIEESNGEKSIVIDVWPKENIKGKGITKSVLLDLLKDSYSKGVTTIQPSYGMWTTQGWGFMENLQNAGFVKEGKKIGGIETFDILESIKNREKENKLGKTDITPKNDLVKYINKYKTDSFLEINRGLRSGNISNENKVILSKISDLINKEGKYIGEVYRGINAKGDTLKMLANLKEGDTYTDKGFISTSKNKSIAENFSQSHTGEPFVFIIKGSKGLDLEGLLKTNNESEVLLDKNSKFTVDDIVKNGNYTEIYLKQIADNKKTDITPKIKPRK